MDNVTNHTVTSTMSIVQLTLAIIQQCTADLHLYPIAIKTRKFVFGVINILQVSLRKCIHKCHIVDVDQEALHFIGIILCNFSAVITSTSPKGEGMAPCVKSTSNLATCGKAQYFEFVMETGSEIYCV